MLNLIPEARLRRIEQAVRVEPLRRQLELTDDQAPFLLEDIGNCVSSTIPIALERLQDDRPLEGKTVLASGFGVGLSWATTILKF